MRIRKKKWVRPFLDNEINYLLKDFKELNVDKPLYLEIGMGMGDFIVNSAALNPDIFYIGLEKDETCVARAIIKAQAKELNNLKIMLVNADGIDEIFPLNSIDRIYLHFSDPWPKKAHHKRRLTYPSFLEKYKRILKDEGSIIFKTDNESFFLDSLTYFETAELKVKAIDYDYHHVLRDEPLTAYESKFKELGQAIYYCHLVK